MRFNHFVSAVAALAVAPLATAQWSDNFESYAIGSPIEGQGGWHNWDMVTTGNQTVNTVVGTTGAAVPFQGTRMLRIVGSGTLSDTVHELNGPYVAGAGTFTFTTMVYTPASLTGRQYVIFMSDYDGSTPGFVFNWAVQSFIDGTTGQVNMDIFNVGASTTVGGAQPIIFDQWVEYKLEIDLNNDTGKLFYAGVEMYSFQYSLVMNGNLLQLDALDLFPASGTVTEQFYDSFVLSPGIAGVPIGTNYCTAVANSTGQPGQLQAFGSSLASQNNVELVASNLPPGAFNYFLASQTQAFVMNPGGSQGHLCLGGQIGRYVGPGLIVQANAQGERRLTLDITMIPLPVGTTPAVAGATWNWQNWYRDLNPGVTSNFTVGVSLTFQ